MNRSSSIDAALEHAHALILAKAGQAVPLAVLAAQTGLGATQLQRRFRARYGVSPAELARSLRLAAFKADLKRGARVSDATYAAGFGSGSRVYERSDQMLGMTPARYRQGGAGVAIRYTTTDTPLGRLLVAATARGICAVMLGDDDAELVQRLAEELPHASRERVDAGRDDWLDAMIARITHELGWHAVDAPTLPPLDVAATAFQWRVWQALTRIPCGQTVSYGALATELGLPRGARAIARACASNRLALVVPCHRVIREDGSLGGWRWGIERKRQLLASEQNLQD
ncbi:MAG TPA: methylated-DNA--[protein]-cysteine S-methyltransferase [Rhodanobacteraceae bacterium]|nr:methylated-DNA--[protein]-cysteine S-methyltransferase [Rhodanobacteraceae bacterium]